MVERMTLNHVVAGSIPAVGGLHIMSVDSSMVRIRAFQARGPGSIPGRRTFIYIRSCGVMVSTADSESADPGSNPGRTIYI